MHLSQISHGLDGPRRTRADGPDIHRSLTYGYGLQQTDRTLTHTDGLYFAVTMFSTVGFGEITAKIEAARLMVTGQMIADLIILGLALGNCEGGGADAGGSAADRAPRVRRDGRVPNAG